MTEPLGGLLSTPTAIVAAGVEVFSAAARPQGADVDWRPPGVGDPADLIQLALDQRRAVANRTAVERMLAAGSVLVDVRPTREVLDLPDRMLLHFGSPLKWEDESGPMRGALVGACLFEGWGADLADTERMLAAAEIALGSCHHHRTIGPISRGDQPVDVDVVPDRPGGRRLGVLQPQRGPGQGAADGRLQRRGADPAGLNARHPRPGAGRRRGRPARRPNRREGDPRPDAADGRRGAQPQPGRRADGAAQDVPAMVAVDARSSDITQVLRFIGDNEHFYLNLGMLTGKFAMGAARDVPGSTMVTVMNRNGTEFGIQAAGTGDRWFTGPANTPVGLFLDDYGPEDANPDIGDSAILKTYGVGGFSTATAPAIVRFVVPDALATTEEMYRLTLAENPAMQIPILGFRGSPPASTWSR